MVARRASASSWHQATVTIIALGGLLVTTSCEVFTSLDDIEDSANCQPESCNGRDDDCDGNVDEDLPSLTLYEDQDNDGYGNPEGTSRQDCRVRDGFADNNDDCDDTQNFVNPGADESVSDGVDSNCDGREACYADEDRDGFAGGQQILSDDTDCDDDGESATAGMDCNDRDPQIHPEAEEVVGDEVDQNCDGIELCYADNDNDNFRTDEVVESMGNLSCQNDGEAQDFETPGDCDDNNALVTPIMYFEDGDQDGVGSNTSGVFACERPDGFVPVSGDCNDGNALINPEVPEICDGFDNDCDTLVDGQDGDLLTSNIVCLDQGVCAGTLPTCTDAGWVCRYTLFDGETETSCDGLDNDCDGLFDEGLIVDVYFDGDNDGFGGIGTSMPGCIGSPGVVTVGGDCDDGDNTVKPDADEVCDGVDNNCDGLIDDQDLELTPPADVCPTDGICAEATVACLGTAGWSCSLPADYQQGAETLCDNRDNDCDGQTDEAISRVCGTDVGVCASGSETCQAGAFVGCTATVGIAPTDSEADAGLCDELDNDCDGEADEGCACTEGNVVSCGTDTGECTTGTQTCTGGAFTPCTGQGPVLEFCDPSFADNDCNGEDDITQGIATAYYLDGDGDGFGTGAVLYKCGALEDEESANNLDCDDIDGNINPGADEVCDGLDNDCDGGTDNNPQAPGFGCNTLGVCAGTVPVCQGAAGWQCIYPPAVYEAGSETSCDMLDNDCDGTVDETLTTPFYWDNDMDSYGAGPLQTRCGARESNQSAIDGDCNDSDMSVNPDAMELVGDNIDQNCDGSEICYVDGDGDDARTNAEVSSTDTTCDGPNEAVAVAAIDCADADPTRFPGAQELCDGEDNDCDMIVDENAMPVTFFEDGDGDGFGDPMGETVSDCTPPSGFAASADDCDDDDSSVFPGATEIPADGTDQNCDGMERCFVDGDNDGYRPGAGTSTLLSTNLDCDGPGETTDASPAGDCADNNAAINPNATEIVGSGADEDCDGSELCYLDSDDDGWRPDSVSTVQSPDATCVASGEARASDPVGDCDDGNPSTNPAAPELCSDGDDNDCDAFTDCDDGECNGDPLCVGSEACNNCVDDDGDDDVDCDDSECSSACSFCDDGFEDNDDRGDASSFNLGNVEFAALCPNDEDFYRVIGANNCKLSVDVAFDHALGDLDVEVQRSDGTVIGSSTSTSDNESLVVDVTDNSFYIRVFSSSCTANTYDIAISRVCDGDVLIGEYIEGTGNNQAIELANGTSNDIDLTGCVVDIYADGSNTPTQSVNLDGATLFDGDVVVICDPGLDPNYLGECDLVTGLSFNGNDAIVVECYGLVQDSLGRVGEDPGTAWTNGSRTTADGGLWRICEDNADTDPFDEFEPSDNDWGELDVDDLTELGSAACFDD